MACALAADDATADMAHRSAMKLLRLCEQHIRLHEPLLWNVRSSDAHGDTAMVVSINRNRLHDYPER